MARESTQTKLTRVRPPRVQISYEVQVGDAIELKEIPFVMGVLGDFTGQPTEPLEPMARRKFIEVTPDNFDDVLGKMKPHLNLSVTNTLSGDPDGSKMKVSLDFRKLDDFDPESVARQVDPLNKLLELRTKLSDLRGNLQTNQKLDEILQEVVRNSDQMSKLKEEIAASEEKGDK